MIWERKENFGYFEHVLWLIKLGNNCFINCLATWRQTSDTLGTLPIMDEILSVKEIKEGN